MFREIRTRERITDRSNQATPGFDPDKRIVVGTNNKDESKAEKVERFDPDKRV